MEASIMRSCKDARVPWVYTYAFILKAALVAEKPLLICKAMGASGFHEFYKDAIEVAARASGKTATAATGGKGSRGGKGSSSAAGAAGSLADGPDGLISKVAVSNKHLLK